MWIVLSTEQLARVRPLGAKLAQSDQTPEQQDEDWRRHPLDTVLEAAARFR